MDAPKLPAILTLAAAIMLATLACAAPLSASSTYSRATWYPVRCDESPCPSAKREHIVSRRAVMPLWYHYDITLEEEVNMPDLALRGIPEDVHRELQAAANRNHRSLNGEILARLTASVRSEPVDIQALLERIRLRREAIGHIDTSENTLREMRDAGRP